MGCSMIGEVERGGERNMRQEQKKINAVAPAASADS